jgi:hypothetical protein
MEAAFSGSPSAKSRVLASLPHSDIKKRVLQKSCLAKYQKTLSAADPPWEGAHDPFWVLRSTLLSQIVTTAR